VILELVSMSEEPFGLPDWTFILAMILLSIGFIIAIILSWIYDIHPDEGMVKTEPAEKVKAEEIPRSSNSWKIASYISFVVIVGLILLNFIPRNRKEAVSEILDKSIAVLPFRNDSPDEEKMYFINGTMEAILNNLCKIEDMRVVSRNSVEQYRNNLKPTPVVAEEQDVSYILAGSGQKLGNRLILTVQLIVGKDDRQMWSRQYDRVIEEVEDMIDIQKEIAQMVANEIEAVITPEEEKLMEKIPTTNLTAFDFYTQGREKMFEFLIGRDNSNLERAENLFHVALEQDSTFAEVYAGLAWVYWYKNIYKDPLAEVFLDSVPILVDKALQINREVSEAYVIRGRYFYEMGEFQMAEEAFNQAIRLNPNDWMAYALKSFLYLNIDLVEYIKNILKTIQHERGSTFTYMLRHVGSGFASAGYFDKGMEYLNQALEFDGDSVSFFMKLGDFEANRGNWDRAIQASLRVLDLDPDHVDALSDLGYNYSFTGQFEKSVEYYERWLDRRSDLDDPQYTNLHRTGYAYFKAGRKKEAEEFFIARFDNCQLIIKLDRVVAKSLYPYYDLAAIYAFRGERDSAYANLRIFNQREMMPLWMVSLINDDPLFDNIRNEPEFQQIVRDVEAKYQAEHERVRKWLGENDML